MNGGMVEWMVWMVWTVWMAWIPRGRWDAESVQMQKGARYDVGIIGGWLIMEDYRV